MPPTHDEVIALKRTWTDKFVRMKPGHERYKRFEGKVGRVVTVNWSGMAVVDFADGGWYDVPCSDAYLEAAEDGAKFDATANSAQAKPQRQG